MTYNEKVLKQSDNSVEIEFTPAEDWDYFDGHFPGFKLLPALAQIEIVIRLAAKYLRSALLIQKAKRLKFSSIIRPGFPVSLALSYKKETGALGFTMKNPEGNIIYSSGTIIIGAENERA
ncbi:MAG: hydroxymyristoyl-ACP dehydratase [Spirochaetaceae bacterium]|jgi:3-hydroxymyristoyl/3-hydroxydecanoyl-(acyl carrier protein) dehydratase|nr:hydroxymyristoyl-ACP dehydratase [Spirochaetaceae bacterium]